ncbi:MAG: hypothetical protein IPP33_04915 [Flavobacteriales bacterium]|nr:hypothetical protein [Flavobacteriales bacterium]
MHRSFFFPSLVVFASAFASILSGRVCAQFTAGRLAVLEVPYTPVGGGGFTVPTNGTGMVIREFTTAGIPGFSVTIPNSGANMLVQHYNAQGSALNRTPTGDRLVFTGYAGTSAPGTIVSQSTSAAVPRGIGTVDATGNFSRPSTTSTFFSGSLVLNATTDGVNYWAGGGNSGVCYLGPGAPVVINASSSATTELHYVGGNLVQGGLTVNRVGSGSPVAPAGLTLLSGLSSGYGLQFNPAGDVCYTATTAQLKKWVLSGGTWTNVYTFSAPTFLQRLAVDWSAPQPIIYGVVNSLSVSEIRKWVDTGSPTTSTLLASTNAAAWYGITFTPGTGCVEGSPCNDGNPNTINDIIRGDCQCAGTALSLSAKVFLEGPYNTGTGLMNDGLRTLADFPLTEPYTALGMNPTGGAATITPSVLATSGNNAIVDWVLVELRDAAIPTTVLLRTPALVQRDGDIVALNGTSTLQLPAVNGSYRVAVRHRNHLGAMTNAALVLSNSTIAVDFTSAATVTWGSNARKDIGGVQLLWCGEVFRNSRLTYVSDNNDRDPILAILGSVNPNATIIGYRVHDVNMDGITSYTGLNNDRDPILVNVGSTTPNSVRTEQLP